MTEQWAAQQKINYLASYDSLTGLVNRRLFREQLERAMAAARERRINLRVLDDSTLAVALDETVDDADLARLFEVFGVQSAGPGEPLADHLVRTDSILSESVFHSHRSETEMLRYLKRLENKEVDVDEMEGASVAHRVIREAAEFYREKFGK